MFFFPSSTTVSILWVHCAQAGFKKKTVFHTHAEQVRYLNTKRQYFNLKEFIPKGEISAAYW